MNLRCGVRRIAAAVALSFLATVALKQASAEPSKAQYELQERCGKTAAAKFESGFPNGGMQDTENGNSVAGYENHYSLTFNKCFILVKLDDYAYKGAYKGKNIVTHSEELWDANENKNYGSYYTHPLDSRIVICELQNKHCESESEWRELIKPFMEN